MYPGRDLCVNCRRRGGEHKGPGFDLIMLLRAGVLALACFGAASDASVVALEDRFPIRGAPFSDRAEQMKDRDRQAYESAFEKFPSLDTCLVTESDGSARPELNWSQITTLAEAETCLFLLSEALQTPEALVDWLRGAGFTATVQDIFGTWPSDRPGTVHATYHFNNSANPDPFSAGQFRLSRLTASGMALGIAFDEASAIQSVRLTQNTE